ncbi:MAG TPA: fatty acid desaturase [Anaeromyxobacteraceae bacterium]|jgi:sphingolipid delta-4 desaturase|nr:fatty acid desaturase [Anaeromyxobacteraceae bacterium]
MDGESGFRRVTWREPHRDRTRALLAAHPEARALCGNAPSTALFVVGIVAAQLALAFTLRQSPWWLVLGAAWALGAVADHALWVLIHDCSHDLVFRRPASNQWLGILANLPILFPAAVSFRKYHLLHHAWQGSEDLDADLPSPLEVRLVGHAWWRKALWLLFFFVAQSTRIPRLRRIKFFDRWYAANLAVQLAFTALAWAVLGPRALAYLFASSAFAIGLHPVGARWIQEHYLTFPGTQETFSYYGPMNLLAFNVGYHNEHHDLTKVPWFRLPALKQLAPELYEPLHAHRSWTRLLLRFVFDPALSLGSRMTRAPSGPARSSDAAAAAPAAGW